MVEKKRHREQIQEVQYQVNRHREKTEMQGENDHNK